MDQERLNDKIALVTGGASGLGAAIAHLFQAHGATVYVADIQVESGRRFAADSGSRFLPLDVSSEESWAAAAREIETRHGRLDVLVNNAGILGPKEASDPENTRLDDWHRVMSVNADGVFLGCKHCIPLMRSSGAGAIINISSIAGLIATPYATAYGASKALVRQLTKSVAQHCAERGYNIRCNSIHPGDVITPMREDAFREDAARAGISKSKAIYLTNKSIPLGAMAEPRDIANAALFLASEESRFVTGAKFIVDGGVVNCESFLLTKQTAL